MNKNIQVGKTGEDLATRYLEKLGYDIIQRNYKCKTGEIDIIAKDNKTIVFVEVKTRSSQIFGNPAESIGSKKLSSIIKALQFWLLINNKTQDDIRVDAIEVNFESGDYKLNHIKNITL